MKAKDAYVNCRKCLQKQLPQLQPSFNFNSSINSTLRGHEITLQQLQKLSSLITYVLTNDDKESYALAVHQ